MIIEAKVTKYAWHQRYAFERFDLEGPMGSHLGGIMSDEESARLLPQA